MKTAGEHTVESLEKALATYRERNAVYKDSFKRWGGVLRALFPDGVRLKTEDDYNRFTCLGHVVDKLVRYTTDFSKPHHDSTLDLGNYAFILRGLDLEMDESERRVPSPVRVRAAEIGRVRPPVFPEDM